MNEWKMDKTSSSAAERRLINMIKFSSFITHHNELFYAYV